MYELFVILYNIGVWVASFFSKKVRPCGKANTGLSACCAKR